CIDRTLQQSDEVRCYYFVYEQREEDRVLETLFRKIQTVQAELGSIGAVLLDEMETALKEGITARVAEKLQSLGKDARTTTTDQELESYCKQQDRIQNENLRAGQLLERSKRALEVELAALRGVVEVGLQLAGTLGLIPGSPT